MSGSVILARLLALIRDSVNAGAGERLEEGAAAGIMAGGAERVLSAATGGVGASGFVELGLGVHASSSNPFDIDWAKAELALGSTCTGVEAGLRA